MAEKNEMINKDIFSKTINILAKFLNSIKFFKFSWFYLRH